MNALSKLTPAQREIVEEFMNATEGTDEYSEALSKLMAIPGADIFIDMKQAQDELASSAGDLSSTMTPIIQSLLDMGIISSDTAKQFFDYIDNIYEAADAQSDLEDTQNELMDNFDSITRLVRQVANSLITGEEGASNMADIWSDLTNTLDIGSTSVDELRSLLGLTGEEYDNQYQSLSDFSDEQLVLAATLKYLSTNLGTYQEGMSAVEIANNLGIVSTTNYDAAMSLLMDHVSTATSDLYTYAEAQSNFNKYLEEATTDFNLLKEAVIELGDTLDITYSNWQEQQKEIMGKKIYSFWKKSLQRRKPKHCPLFF